MILNFYYNLFTITFIRFSLQMKCFSLRYISWRNRSSRIFHFNADTILMTVSIRRAFSIYFIRKLIRRWAHFLRAHTPTRFRAFTGFRAAEELLKGRHLYNAAAEPLHLYYRKYCRHGTYIYSIKRRWYLFYVVVASLLNISILKIYEFWYILDYLRIMSTY